ncbi:MAG: RimK-like ATPgrasp N-terminal domain-containing protein [Gemmatimonadetes bacterium]|nr:RimK-like ATPgrasp N-terminal domain-containing protein [Gemmatimonadota bacterium]
MPRISFCGAAFARKELSRFGLRSQQTFRIHQVCGQRSETATLLLQGAKGAPRCRRSDCPPPRPRRPATSGRSRARSTAFLSPPPFPHPWYAERGRREPCPHWNREQISTLRKSPSKRKFPASPRRAVRQARGWYGRCSVLAAARTFARPPNGTIGRADDGNPGCGPRPAGRPAGAGGPLCARAARSALPAARRRDLRAHLPAQGLRLLRRERGSRRGAGRDRPQRGRRHPGRLPGHLRAAAGIRGAHLLLRPAHLRPHLARAVARPAGGKDPRALSVPARFQAAARRPGVPGLPGNGGRAGVRRAHAGAAQVHHRPGAPGAGGAQRHLPVPLRPRAAAGRRPAGGGRRGRRAHGPLRRHRGLRTLGAAVLGARSLAARPRVAGRTAGGGRATPHQRHPAGRRDVRRGTAGAVAPGGRRVSRTRVIAVVSEAADGRGLPQGMRVTADRYLEGGDEFTGPGAVVVNLCRSWKYGSKGYYVSLLADARGQLPIPGVDVSEAFGDAYALFRALQEAGVPTVDPEEMRARRRAARDPAPVEDDGAEEDAAPRAFPVPLLRVQHEGGWSCRPAADDEAAETLVFLGSAADARFRGTALAVYREWPAPVLRLQLLREDGEWKVTAMAPVPPHRLGEDDRRRLCEALADQKRVVRRGREAPREERRASIAVLVDPDDVFSPSSPETLDRLQRIALRMNVHVRRIGLDELHRLPEYDALFIRALTGVSEPAFQFALRAEALGMPVVDDSQSIIRCGNKVFLDELLRREGIPTPRTRIVTRATPWDEVAALGLPLVIKLPDGSFSSAVHKVASRDEFRRHADEMFRRSPLIIAQEFLPTDYDWRITVLDGRLLFACKYHMARGHWQVRAESAAGKERYGRVEAVPRDAAPGPVVQAALRAARLIGHGLYGVDLKETPDGPVVIEVNDNPNLDVGYDDAADGAAIYEDLVQFFVRRIEQGPPDEAEAPGDTAGTRLLERARKPIPPAAPARGERHYRPFEVAGMELEYPTVDRDLNVVSLVEPAFRVLAGRGTSDVDLGAVGFSNEIADHVFEIKTQPPMRSLADAERVLAEGIQRFSALLHAEFGARLMPTGMHPWFDPRKGRLWTRSGLRIYTTYARLFDVRTHGWMNVHAAHLNLPLGREVDAMAMHTAAALLIPYLPALAASSPMYDGDLQPAVDGRLAWILEHQARIPESCGALVPEYVDSFADYKKRILAPMYRALDRLPDTGAIRHEFFNTRGAILRFARRAMEVRVLDTQECVKMDVAVAVFVRAALKQLTARVAAGRVELPEHAVLVEDFRACIRDGSAARVRAPHLDVDRDADGAADARTALRHLLAGARRAVRKDEAAYLDLVARMIETGTLSERIRAEMAPFAQADDETFTEGARRIYIELIDCLEANEPWARRGL